jgi:hypothetical protein
MGLRYWFLFFILIVLGASACKRGCKDVNCLNNGECQSGGTCSCPGRWSGELCDSLCPIGLQGPYCSVTSRTKFVRNWNASTSSGSSGLVKHPLYVTNGPIIQQIIITNFNNENYTVIGTLLDYDKFEILTQNATGGYTGVINGSGYLNGENMAISLTKQGVDYFANCNK